MVLRRGLPCKHDSSSGERRFGQPTPKPLRITARQRPVVIAGQRPMGNVQFGRDLRARGSGPGALYPAWSFRPSLAPPYPHEDLRRQVATPFIRNGPLSQFVAKSARQVPEPRPSASHSSPVTYGTASRPISLKRGSVIATNCPCLEAVRRETVSRSWLCLPCLARQRRHFADRQDHNREAVCDFGYRGPASGPIRRKVRTASSRTRIHPVSKEWLDARRRISVTHFANAWDASMRTNCPCLEAVRRETENRGFALSPMSCSAKTALWRTEGHNREAVQRGRGYRGIGFRPNLSQRPNGKFLGTRDSHLRGGRGSALH